MSGNLPGKAILHSRQLTLFGMICRLHGNILHLIAQNLLIAMGDNDTSWFGQIRSLCFQYALPHPLKVFEEQAGKEDFKSLVKANIVDYWQK